MRATASGIPVLKTTLDGYRVYRKIGDGDLRRIGGAVVRQPSFLDPARGTRSGRASYRVTAMDRAVPPNESGLSSDGRAVCIAADPREQPVGR